MRRYETTYIIDGNLEQDKVDEISKRVLEIIANAGGKLIEEKSWGKRRLAYEIKKRQYGHYIILNYEAPSSLVEELERFFRINQFILRYLSIYQDQRMLKLIILDEERKRKEEEKALELTQAMNKSEE
jgi:small subunit ribosomal protein S6